MKITRIEDYRLNFELNGFHYSLQEDYDEGYCSLQCKETKQSWGTEAFNNARYRDVISHFTTGKDCKTGSTFNQKIEISLLESFINEIISGSQYHDTNIYINSRIVSCEKQIAFYESELKRLKGDN